MLCRIYCTCSNGHFPDNIFSSLYWHSFRLWKEKLNLNLMISSARVFPLLHQIFSCWKCFVWLHNLCFLLSLTLCAIKEGVEEIVDYFQRGWFFVPKRLFLAFFILFFVSLSWLIRLLTFATMLLMISLLRGLQNRNYH